MTNQRGFLLYAIGALLIALAVIALLWMRLDKVAEQRDKAEAALVTQASNEKVVTKYVDKIVSIPGPVVIRDRIVRGLCNSASLPSTGRVDAETGTDPGTGPPDFAGRLAADLAAAQRNRAKLEALQEVLKPQISR